jgi:histidine ammonia-lyase
MGLNAALKLRAALDNIEKILSIELMAAAQGIDFRRQAVGERAELGRGTREVYRLIRERVPFIEADTYMAGYVESVRHLIASGTLLTHVNRAMQGW